MRGSLTASQSREILELPTLVRRLVEETVRRVRGGQHEEDSGAPEVRALVRERLEDADGGFRVDAGRAVPLEVAELAGRRVVEREDHGRRAGGNGDAPVDQVAEADEAVTARVQRLE